MYSIYSLYVFNNGIIIQFGHQLFYYNGTSVTFPISFNSQVVIVTGSFASDHFTKSLNINSGDNHKTGFTGFPTTDGNVGIDTYSSWIAMGY